MLELIPFKENNAAEISRWVCDEATLRKWSADTYSFPLNKVDIVDVYEKMGKNGDFFPFVAVLDGKTVGHLVMWIIDPYTVRFGFIILDPAMRGEGLGKRMLTIAKKYATENFGAKKINLGVFLNNESAFYCYSALGFYKTDARPAKEFYFFGEKWTCAEMDLDIN